MIAENLRDGEGIASRIEAHYRSLSFRSGIRRLVLPIVCAGLCLLLWAAGLMYRNSNTIRLYLSWADTMVFEKGSFLPFLMFHTVSPGDLLPMRPDLKKGLRDSAMKEMLQTGIILDDGKALRRFVAHLYFICGSEYPVTLKEDLVRAMTLLEKAVSLGFTEAVPILSQRYFLYAERARHRDNHLAAYEYCRKARRLEPENTVFAKGLAAASERVEAHFMYRLKEFIDDGNAPQAIRLVNRLDAAGFSSAYYKTLKKRFHKVFGTHGKGDTDEKPSR